MTDTTTDAQRPYTFNLRAELLAMAEAAQSDLAQAREAFDVLATSTPLTTGPEPGPISPATASWLRDEALHLLDHLMATQRRLETAQQGLRMYDTANACRPPPAA
jgi:hypothetical protein